MRVRQCLCLFLFLCIPATAAAQHHPGRQNHPGGMAPHPGQAPQHMMTPGMQHEQMMQQFWREQMMLNQMMSQPRGGGARPQSRSNSPKSQTGKNQPQSATNQSPPNGNQGSKSAHPAQTQRQSAQPGGSKERQANHNSETKSTHDAPAVKEIHHDRERILAKAHSKDANAANKRMLAMDQRSISLLRNVHAKLREADHDYQGHRMRAMDHVASALEHLGSPAFNSDFGHGYSAGNLPQAKSDEILRNALIHLKTAESELATGANRAAHHGNARAKVAEAIGELHIALNVR
jgi:hypothetical protein